MVNSHSSSDRSQSYFSIASEAESLVPFGRNKQFIGCHSQLQELVAKIDSEGFEDDCQRVAFAGLGGVGKTQIALEAVQKDPLSYRVPISGS
jgi:hypothetical protein